VTPPDVEAYADNRSAQVIQIESLGKGGIAVMLAAVIVALIIAALAWGESRRAMDRAYLAEREARLAMQDVLDLRTKIAEEH
jgi:hypothetical protein